MNRTLEQLQVEVLRLSAEGRAKLAAILLESLEEGSERAEREVEEMWAAEAEGRLIQHEAGAVEAIPADEALADIRRQLRAKGTA
jgi:hypothetical protein